MQRRIFISGGVSLILLIVASLAPAQTTQPRKPTLFICGDSTAAPTRPPNPTIGWGEKIAEFFDTERIKVDNRALGGRSARTFIAERRWKAVADQLQPGDFVFIQFGHNDSKGPLSADRYDLPGLGDEIEEGTQIRTFGFYMKQMVDESLAKGVRPIILSPVPRNKWANGKVVRGEENHGPWAEEVAKLKNVPFVDVNATIADIYDQIGPAKVKAMLFTPQDNTHAHPTGARLNAACVVQGIVQLSDVNLKDYLKPESARVVADLIAGTPKEAEAFEAAPATLPKMEP